MLKKQELNFSFRKEIYDYVQNKYKTKIEFLWKRYPNYAVFRNNDNKKWYGVIMDIPYKNLGIEKEGIVDVLNVKVYDMLSKEIFMQQDGILKSYHMSGNWISVLLDGTTNFELVLDLIDQSFDTIAKRKKRL